MRLKNLSCGVLSAMMVLSCNSAFATGINPDDVVVKLDGRTLEFDVNPIIENGRTLVPFRKIFEELGCSVSYQEDSEGMLVSAWHGSDYIRLRIGQYDMGVNGKTTGLEVAPKILDGRTLVPLRAVSEALDCKVKWDGDTRTVTISLKQGQYKVRTENIVKVIKADDGTMVMSIDCAYPVIENENNSAFCEYINKEYKEQAENYAKSVEAEWAEDAKDIYSQMSKENFTPLAFSLSYEITLNRNNMLSITTHDYANTLGAHPNSSEESRTFQMILEKELSLLDILECDQDKVDSIVEKAFNDSLKNYPYELDMEDVNKNLKAELHNVNYYLTDDSLVMYFNPYQIGPYAMGAPTAVLPYTGPDGIVRIDLSGANLDKVEFELDGNPTTGYDWGIIESDADVVNVESEYVPNNVDKNIVGGGGKYKFTITGVGKGNCTVKFSYMRSWEKEKPALKTVAYDLYVNEENKITVINIRELENEGTVTYTGDTRTITKYDTDLIELSDGNVYVIGNAYIFDANSKQLKHTELKVGDRVRTATYNDSLAIIRNNQGDSVEGYKTIKKVDDDIIELEDGEVFITGNAYIYEAKDSLKCTDLKLNDRVILTVGDNDLIVIVKE